MTDLEKLTAFMRDMQALDKMLANYPPESKCGRAVAACLKAFQEHGEPLRAFLGHEPEPTPKPKGKKC